jgi:hypothetical protein
MNRVRPRTRPGRRGRYLIAGAIACCFAIGLLSPQLQSSQKTPLVPPFSSSFAHERAFSSPDAIDKFLIALANGWNAAYSNYDRTIPLIARSIDEKSGLDLISHFMDMQRRLLRPCGGRFGELDLRRLRVLQAQLLQRRIIRQPVDFARAVNYDILTEA